MHLVNQFRQETCTETIWLVANFKSFLKVDVKKKNEMICITKRTTPPQHAGNYVLGDHSEVEKQLLEIYGVLMIYGISSVTCETKQGLAAVMLCMQPRATRQNYKSTRPQR